MKHRAAPATFTDTAKFEEAQDRTQNEISKLVAVGEGDGEAAVIAQISALNEACDPCHNSFRARW